MKLQLDFGSIAEAQNPLSSEWAKYWTVTDAQGRVATNVEDWELVEQFGLTAIIEAFRAALSNSERTDG